MFASGVRVKVCGTDARREGDGGGQIVAVIHARGGKPGARTDGPSFTEMGFKRKAAALRVNCPVAVGGVPGSGSVAVGSLAVMADDVLGREQVGGVGVIAHGIAVEVLLAVAPGVGRAEAKLDFSQSFIRPVPSEFTSEMATR